MGINQQKSLSKTYTDLSDKDTTMSVGYVTDNTLYYQVTLLKVWKPLFKYLSFDSPTNCQDDSIPLLNSNWNINGGMIWTIKYERLETVLSK